MKQSRNYFSILLVVAGALLFNPTQIHAAPAKIAHQGRLLNAQNQPISTPVSVEFAIYGAETGGNPSWYETQFVTPDALGFYETFLGEGTPLPSISEPAYLQLTVNGEVLNPRLEFGSVPFALDGVPSGFSILGETSASPTGYFFVGSFALAAPGSNCWTTKAPMPTARASLAGAAVNGKIYAMGGFSVDALTIVEEYDPMMDTWTAKTPMPEAHAGFVAVSVNGKIYTIGGQNGGGEPIAVEEYDPATDTWTPKTPMPTPRYGPAGAAVNGKIYAIGGSGHVRNDVVEEYDPATDTWTPKAPMLRGRTSLAAVSVNGKIYAIGGSGYETAVEEYDPATDTWTEKASMPTGRGSPAAVEVNGIVYVIGGNNNGFLATVEAYDPATNTWTTRTPMLTARNEFVAAAFSDKIYAIGGNIGVGFLDLNEEYTVPGFQFYVHRKI